MGQPNAPKHWLARLWFFLNDSENRSREYLIASRNKAAFGAALSVGLVGLTGWQIWQGSEVGLPKYDSLRAVSGHLLRADEGKHDIWITLEESPGQFDYISKEGGFGTVWDGLCKRCETVVWVDPEDRGDMPTVFQIAVNGRVVRSYRDVKVAWISDNRVAGWLFAFFLFGGVYLAFYARRQHRRIREVELMP